MLIFVDTKLSERHFAVRMHEHCKHMGTLYSMGRSSQYFAISKHCHSTGHQDDMEVFKILAGTDTESNLSVMESLFIHTEKPEFTTWNPHTPIPVPILIWISL